MANAMPWLETAARTAELWWSRHVAGTSVPVEERLRLLVRYAREFSPFYRELYGHLPRDPPLAFLPPVDKAALMARFDDWSTDRAVTLEAARGFLADPAAVGEQFLGRYWVWKSSGTSGRTGIFVQDDEAMAVYDALVASQLGDAPWSPRAALRAWAGRGRSALVVATGDHFASIASWERTRRMMPAGEARSFPVTLPLRDLARALQDYQPTFLAGYPSILALLAREQAARRLAIAPALVWCGGETLTPAARRSIEEAFGCAAMNEYGASECLSIAHECREGWQHLHAEWVILEPVDDEGVPAGAGTASHSALLTNLANWTQPVIRYDLSDRITMRGSPCPCGNPSPAFRVEGRTGDLLALRSRAGESVLLSPLALCTVIEAAIDDAPFQVAQQGERRLALRIADGGARRGAVAALREWLATQGLRDVDVVLERGPPRRDRASGKTRAVVRDAANAG